MAKVHICDLCRAEGKTTLATGGARIKGLSMFNIDMCPEHAKSTRSMTAVEHVRKSYALSGVELRETDEEITKKFLRR